MRGRVDRPEAYMDIATKCVEIFCKRNRQRCLVLLSCHDSVFNVQESTPYRLSLLLIILLFGMGRKIIKLKAYQRSVF